MTNYKKKELQELSLSDYSRIKKRLIKECLQQDFNTMQAFAYWLGYYESLKDCLLINSHDYEVITDDLRSNTMKKRFLEIFGAEIWK